ncbi:MAG: hypothetical protein PVI06_15745 [Desulfobacterales bacterium]|jgi:hypothetical protein
MKLWRRSGILLAILVGVVAAANVHCRAARASLKVLDINVWSGLDYVGYLKMGEYETKNIRQKRFEALVTQLKLLDPDVIGIHEANKLPEYIQRLSRELGLAAFYHVGVGGIRLGPVGLPWNLREGDAILARKSLNPMFVGRKQLSGGYVGKRVTFHFEDATQVIAIRITYQNRPVYVFATHWHASLPDSPVILTEAKKRYEAGTAGKEAYHMTLAKIQAGVSWRMAESKKTIEFIKNTVGDKAFILMGDLNAESYSKEMGHLLSSGMIDTFRRANPKLSGYTWDPRTNSNQIKYYLDNKQEDTAQSLFDRLAAWHRRIPRRIDYILVGPFALLESGKISIRSSRVVMDQMVGGVHASDHYGVFTEFVLF